MLTSKKTTGFPRATASRTAGSAIAGSLVSCARIWGLLAGERSIGVARRISKKHRATRESESGRTMTMGQIL
eukprot:scaffold1253_cov245-Pinguiococcus_pyrenoidosus.AAC.7